MSSGVSRLRGDRAGAIVLLAVFWLVVWGGPGRAIQPEYRDLAGMLREGRVPDTSVLATLPRPRTAREFWLRSRVRSEYAAARKDLREAVERSGEPDARARYLEEWIQLCLLAEDAGRSNGAAFLEEHLDWLRDRGGIAGRLWLRAARLARSLDEASLAEPWFERAVEEGDSPVRQSARLNLAELALDTDHLERARRLLDDYFLEASRGTPPEYWLLRGRLFERTGADSEAYVAYSHIVHEYPRSMLMTLAERRLNDLPVPRAPAEGASRADDADSRAVREDTPPAASASYRIQVGSFRRRHHAADLKRRVAAVLKRRVMIQRVHVRGRTYYRVQVAGFASREEALRGLSSLEREGFDGFVIQP